MKLGQKFGAAALILLLGSPAIADRYPEKLLDLDAAKSDYSRSASTVYLQQALKERKKANHFLADYLARRAHGLLAGNLRPNINVRLLESILQGSRRDTLYQLAERILAQAECPQGVSEDILNSAFLRFDILAFQEATSDDSHREWSIDSIEKSLETSNEVGSCEHLPSVDANSMNINWNIKSQPLEINESGSGIPWSDKFSDSEFTSSNSWSAHNGRSYQFGISLRKSGLTIAPCEIDPNQITLYYSIDSSEHQGEANELNFKMAAEKAASSLGILIEGHADSGGVGSRNLEISTERVLAAARELERNGIVAGKLYLITLGAHCPQVSMGSDAYVQANRRLVFRFID